MCARVQKLHKPQDGAQRPRVCRLIVCLLLLGANSSQLLEAQESQPIETNLGSDVETVRVIYKNEQGEEENTLAEVWARKDGGILALLPNGQLKTIFKEQQLSVKTTQEKMQPMTQQEIFEELKGQLPTGFALRKTKHYLIVYNTSPAYAEWAGELFERLYRGFYNYWKQIYDIELEEPRFPLVAVVFRDQQSYIRFAQRFVGDSAKTMIGYYNMQTNRMVSYDLTGINGLANGANPQASNRKLIDQILTSPGAERTVATIVHEAVHQIAYNSGLQTRLADNPRWLSEGMAMYFESPDFKNKSGWSMGKVNRHNLLKFKQNFRQRKPDSLSTLISTDKRLLNSREAALAYPESWALTFFLMKTMKEEFRGYLTELQELPPLGPMLEKKRVETFKKYFGEDMQVLERNFLRYISRQR